MNTESSQTFITAVRPNMAGHVVRALPDLADFQGFTFDQIRKQGRGRGQGGAYVSTDMDLTYHHYLELRFGCRFGAADEICGRITTAAWTGRKGDEIVYTTPLHTFVRSREIGCRPERSDA